MILTEYKWMNEEFGGYVRVGGDYFKNGEIDLSKGKGAVLVFSDGGIGVFTQWIEGGWTSTHIYYKTYEGMNYRHTRSVLEVQEKKIKKTCAAEEEGC